ncbi:MAG: hypothetical protein H7210_08365 [Pyrinomonadaceae bacterium]|nr:hypothetical protein [Phycisphaerales bacterium]
MSPSIFLNLPHTLIGPAVALGINMRGGMPLAMAVPEKVRSGTWKNVAPSKRIGVTK